MALPEVQCTGSLLMNETEVFKECVKVKKVFDEFVLRECIDGIEFETDGCPENYSSVINPMLILRHCKILNQQISDASINSQKRLRFAGKCCTQVYAKDENNNIIKLKVKSIPSGTKLSKGHNGELCFNFGVKRVYPDANQETFDRLVHFIEQENFELQCLAESIIDEENNQVNNGVLTTGLGIFVAIKFSAEVQICIPVFGYCQITDECTDDDFCDSFELEDIPNFNPPQLDEI
ncbi:MAG: hypothetical protein M0P77_05765 [Firmicutes bacterium]|nr:hypothetical protein [Bacillota bacterium]